MADTDAVNITIRNVPGPVHRELAARAARRGQSLQEFVLGELTRLCERPGMPELMERIRARKEASGTHVSRQDILDALDEGRR